MVLGQLEKSLGVNPFGNHVEIDRKPEDVHDVVIERDEKVIRTIKKYGSFYQLTLNDRYENYSKKLGLLDLEILEPSQIDHVLQRLTKLLPDDKLENGNIGIFISSLINSSFAGGKNDFIITANNPLIPDIGALLIGADEKKLKINLVGAFGTNTCSNAKNAEITIRGSVGYRTACDIDNCEINIYGNVGESSCELAYGSKIIVYGTTGEGFGRSSHGSTFKIGRAAEGNLGEYSRECTFFAYDNVGENCGERARKSSFAIKGNVMSGLGNNSQECNYIISNRIIPLHYKNEEVVHEVGWGSTNSIYATPNEDTFKTLSDVIKQNDGNQVRRILLDDKNNMIKREK